MEALKAEGIETLALDVLSETSIATAVSHDLSVFSHIAVTQAFLPLLLKAVDARGSSIIANQTSSVYNPSKAALAMLSDSMRLELYPFGIKVVDLRTGVVQPDLTKNLQDTQRPSLPVGIARSDIHCAAIWDV
ncbi:hypothetical protein F5X97DRAFT_327257 [Nemania serpens]|nr:hypothetical protein F5X97DRAFT_327257 [Nemania serpens]